MVKINIAEVVRRELARPRWAHEHVAMGTNTDPYQRAEGRYRLMPGVISALTDSGTPFSILTKGTMLSRDLRLLRRRRPVCRSASRSHSRCCRTNAPSPRAGDAEPAGPARTDPTDPRRRAAVRGAAGADLPYLTDSTAQLEALVDEVAAAGATRISGIALHLRPGAREWFFGWLRRERPDLVPAYERLYARGANAPKEYRTDLRTRLRSILSRRSLQRADRLSPPPIPPPESPISEQAQLF